MSGISRSIARQSGWGYEEIMKPHAHVHKVREADEMIGTPPSHGFGQSIDPCSLSPLARQMAAAIGDGGPAPWAGFVWHQPCRARSATYEQSSELGEARSEAA
jgi:hypothetical protein